MEEKKPITRTTRIGEIEYTLEYNPYHEMVWIRAEKDGKYAGTLSAQEPHGEPVLEMAGAYSKGKRGSRTGTRMYEMLAAFACERGRVLVSDRARTDASEGFWRKQFDKGRAVHQCLTFDEAGWGQKTEWTSCPPDKDKYDKAGTWTRYKLKSCPAPTNLEGLRRRRRSRRR